MANNKFLPSNSKVVFVHVPLSTYEKGAEIQSAHIAPVSLAAIWREALRLGLPQLLKNVKEQQREQA